MGTHKHTWGALLVSLILLAISSSAYTVPDRLPLEIRHFNVTTGLPVNGTYSMNISVYDDASRTTLLYSEIQSVSFDDNGLAGIYLDATIDFEEDTYLCIDDTGDGESTGCMEFGFLPYSKYANLANGISGTGTIITTGDATVGALTVTGNATQEGFSIWDTRGGIPYTNLTIAADDIPESAILFSTTCGSGNRLYISGGDLACEAATVYSADESWINLIGAQFTLNETYLNESSIVAYILTNVSLLMDDMSTAQSDIVFLQTNASNQDTRIIFLETNATNVNTRLATLEGAGYITSAFALTNHLGGTLATPTVVNTAGLHYKNATAGIPTCGAGEFATFDGTDWSCATPAGAGDITSVEGLDDWIYNGTDTGDVGLRYNETKYDEFGNLRWIELGDNFIGDVTGPYDATIVGDNSHDHDQSTVSGFLLLTGGTVDGNVLINGNFSVIGDVVNFTVTEQELNGSFLPGLDKVFYLGSEDKEWLGHYIYNLNYSKINTVTFPAACASGEAVTDLDGASCTAFFDALADFTGTLTDTALCTYNLAGTEIVCNTATTSFIANSNDQVTPDNVLSTGQTDEYCLTYEATGGTWEWQVCGAGGGGDPTWIVQDSGYITPNVTIATTGVNMSGSDVIIDVLTVGEADLKVYGNESHIYMSDGSELKIGGTASSYVSIDGLVVQSTGSLALTPTGSLALNSVGNMVTKRTDAGNAQFYFDSTSDGATNGEVNIVLRVDGNNSDEIRLRHFDVFDARRGLVLVADTTEDQQYIPVSPDLYRLGADGYEWEELHVDTILSSESIVVRPSGDDGTDQIAIAEVSQATHLIKSGTANPVIALRFPDQGTGGIDFYHRADDRMQIGVNNGEGGGGDIWAMDSGDANYPNHFRLDADSNLTLEASAGNVYLDPSTGTVSIQHTALPVIEGIIEGDATKWGKMEFYDGSGHMVLSNNWGGGDADIKLEADNDVQFYSRGVTAEYLEFNNDGTNTLLSAGDRLDLETDQNPGVTNPETVLNVGAIGGSYINFNSLNHSIVNGFEIETGYDVLFISPDNGEIRLIDQDHDPYTITTYLKLDNSGTVTGIGENLGLRAGAGYNITFGPNNNAEDLVIYDRGGAIGIKSVGSGVYIDDNLVIETANDAPLRVESTDGTASLRIEDDSTTDNSLFVRAIGDVMYLTASGSGGRLQITTDTGVTRMSTEATAPATCSIGDIYFDSSGGFCACTASNSWENMGVTGNCT